MPYVYDFFLLKRSECKAEDYFNWKVFPKLDEPDKYPNFSCVRMDGNFTEYIWHYLEWVPCYWPHQNMRAHQGFDSTGPGVAFSDGAKALHQIGTSLISLFSTAPEIIKLSNGMTWTSDSELISLNEISRNYFDIDKKTVILQLEKLVNIAQIVSLDDSEYYIGYNGL